MVDSRLDAVVVPELLFATVALDVAACKMPLLLGELVLSLEKANNVSGKFGGVAGVLAGVHICEFEKIGPNVSKFSVISNCKQKSACAFYPIVNLKFKICN